MNDKVRILMDGRTAEVPAGSTILDAAGLLGIHIPVLCYSPLLHPLENCRLCVVRVAGEQRFKAACSTRVAEGMEITTEDEDLRRTRKLLLDLLLDTHYGDCVAPCSATCPAGVDIQGYLALIRHGEYREAVRLIKEKIPMPATIGRVCPHPCETACRRHLVDDAVAINWCKRFLADWEMNAGERVLPPVPPATGHRVAIVGGGPAGLSAAYYLRSMGHGATIFEAREKLGGMLRYGIPAYRLPREVLDWEIEGIIGLGVEVKTGVQWGRDFTLGELKRDGFDAVFVAIGAWATRRLGIEGEDLKGVERGIELLEKMAQPKRRGLKVGKRVAVIGGGNVAIDAARTALRLGAEKVTILYRRSRNEMPASPEEVEAVQEEGVDIQFLVAPTQLMGKKGVLRRIEFIRMELGAPDAGGRRRPVPIEGSEVMMEVDQVISAIGQYPQIPMEDATGGSGYDLPVTRWSTIGGDPASMHTGRGVVFVGGDVFRGPATVVAALADGRKAAHSLDRYFVTGRVESEPVEFNISKGDLQTIDREPFSVLRTMSRESMAHLEPTERVSHFQQVELGFSLEQARREAVRCLSCGCSAAFDCRLRQLMNEFQVNWRDQPGNKVHHQRVTAVDTHRLIALDPNKCIRCERCYVACAAFQVSDAINLKEWPRFNERCVNCGLCVDLCPTGALMEKQEGKAVDRLDWRGASTHCIHCGLGCELELKFKEESLVWIADGALRPPSWASTCRRGRFRVFDGVWLGERVLKPMVRRGGALREVSWREAVEAVISGFQSIHEGKGAAALGALASPRATNESLYLLQKWMRAGWQSHNVDFPGREPWEKLRAVMDEHAAGGGVQQDLAGLRTARAFFVCGDNLEELSPVVATVIRRSVKNRDVPVWQISSRPDELTPFATVALHAEPARWSRMLKDLLDAVIQSRGASGSPLHRAHAASSPSRGKPVHHDCRQGELPGEVWEALKEAVSSTPSIAFVFPDSLAETAETMPVLETLVRLAAARTASQGEAGAWLYPLTAEINTFGGLLMGVSPRRLPGMMDVADPAASRLFSEAWHSPELPLEHWVAVEELLEAGLIRGLFVQEAHLLWEKDPGKWKDLLGRVELLAVADCSPGPALDLAHVVLPMAGFGEQQGTVINQEGTILDLRRVFEPQGESLGDWEIPRRLLAAQGLHAPDGLESIQKEMRNLVPQLAGMARLDP
ncbi:MAG: FAD-dependent oxidoreductase [Syntrophobacteraceae bacterium]|jgi:formate dehydrogenase major subunit|nr:FAD-dependent oxidoreductase [Syntrophobacteraceae bacterium]